MRKVSVVTVCFNAVDSIEKTIQSVISQTYKNIEYIVVDGGSTDGTLEIINIYRDKISKLVSEPDKGIYDAMNKGIRLCTGEWLNFMNAGDMFADENILKEVVEGEIEDADVIYGDTIYCFNDTKKLGKASFFSGKDYNLPFCHQSVLVKSELAKKYPFDLRYRVAGDYNFFYILYTNNNIFRYFPLPIAKYSIGGYSYKYRATLFTEISEIVGMKKNFLYYLTLNWLKFKLFWLKILPESIVERCRQIIQKRS